MGISSSLFSGISGLSTHGNAMSVIGDNIANVNTIGFKSSRTTFEDVLSQSVSTASGSSQIGRGTALSDIDTLFQQGSFESTSNATDLAIGGNGFFIVSPLGSETEYYTRAGQFRFNADGYFVNPAGYVARGWALDDNGTDQGTLTDIRLSAFTSPPEATEDITAITNLDSTDISNSDSLFAAWNATAAEPIGDSAYGYQTAIRVYDALGNSHDVTIYYDKINAASEYNDGAMDFDNTWEYIVACNPAADERLGFDGMAQQGILMRGTMAFDSSSGALDRITSFVCDPTADPSVAANWTTAAWSLEGYPICTANFVTGVDQEISLQFGIRSTNATWTTGAGIADNVGDIAGGAALPTSSWEPQALTSTQYASASTTVYQTQDGYGTGFLENISVDTDGVMVGHYSNGQILYLYRVGLAKFNNDQALNKVGGNLWAATRASGDAITGHPGENGLGRIAPNSLEQSNVDIASEFVKMITTQRGFQANSRIITTTDDMLQELINLKR
ncbi:MAG: flagellar hook protein FlgE [Deltaproteobacteria bacterium]|nr:flagellar hook protein FlgE [Deltaproteobacteria bacterium]HPW68672.1 flagellar hook protein FlgE [Deltaproteobacteria bacterium]